MSPLSRARARAAGMLLAGLCACGDSAVKPEPDAVSDASSSSDASDATTPSDANTSTDEGTSSDDAEVADVRDAPDEPPPPPEPYARPTYEHLRETGYFAASSGPTGATPAEDLIAFEPTHKLWSDAAAKRRWIRLPPGTRIDTSDMDHWVFPVGTKVWKEFSLEGVLLETRLIERYGTGPEDYWMGAFVWNVEQTDATFTIDGQDNILSTPHDAPAQKVCGACHRGDAGRVLGLSAIQLSRQPGAGTAAIGPTLTDLAEHGLLSVPPAPGETFPIPGDEATALALGYLHANCGHCHNPNGTSWPDTQMVLRSRVSDYDASTSAVVQSLIGVPIQYWRGGEVTVRVAPGEPSKSGIVVRMSTRGTKDQMPPLATEFVDTGGLSVVQNWIMGLPH